MIFFLEVGRVAYFWDSHSLCRQGWPLTYDVLASTPTPLSYALLVFLSSFLIFILIQGFMYPKLTLNSVCYQRQPLNFRSSCFPLNRAGIIGMNQGYMWLWEQTPGFMHVRQSFYELSYISKPIINFFYNVVMSQINLVATASRVKGLKIIMYLGKVWCG